MAGRQRFVVACAFAGVLVVTACGASPNEQPVLTAAQAFEAAVTGKNGLGACQLLTERARQSTESFGQHCADQLTQLDGNVGAVQKVEVWGDSAEVRFENDTMFMARFPAGWLVRAAGCQPQGEQPYQCEVGG
jgi:hypothetical protein